MNDVDEALTNLYKVFRGYPLKPKIHGCPHCELDSAESTLHLRQLHNLTWDDFGVYPFKAMTTFGDLDDFKHFLPRLFELYRNEPEGSRWGTFMLFEKLNYGAWKTWPASETSVVETYLRLWQVELIEQKATLEGDLWQVEEILREFANYGFTFSGMQI